MIDQAIELIISSASSDQRKMLISVLGKGFCPTGAGGGVDPSCGSGGGGSSGGGVSETDHIDKFGNSNRPAAYVNQTTGTKTVKIAENGQIKLSRPKNAAEGVAQLKAMEKILDAAEKDTKVGLPKVHQMRAEMAVYHATQQMKRAMGMGYHVLGVLKSIESELLDLLSRLESKYKLTAVTDPGDEDPVFE